MKRQETTRRCRWARGSYEYCSLPAMPASSLCSGHYLAWRDAVADWKKLLDAGEEKQQ